jgi:hypothetical protein
MGNVGGREAGRPEWDFSGLYVDGEAWNDAQGHSNFLSKIQKSLLEPSFVSALSVDQTEEQVSLLRLRLRLGPNVTVARSYRAMRSSRSALRTLRGP